jgi:hypothetical protein
MPTPDNVQQYRAQSGGKKDISYIEYNEGIAAVLATTLCTYLTH